ncbi:hypothetical protein AVO45_11415 [Ruegeria marisrubri]|uniref:Phospholipase A2 n=1 Tax=Ruegeria marisrubri TaxID=1685379 RepID=A0A0X3TMZ7_9RHOB|nr:hypothetical protein [Ruegeria marisrubri]KUJ76401.1 hypothetical protein AVO45_11415 [Ruegeria marisrubri]
MRILEVAILATCLASPLTAQEFAQRLEMPGHRALMQAREGADLSPFETDGCSGGLSSSWELVADTFPDFASAHENAPPWEACCVIHDRAYHDAGGASEAEASYQARLTADEELQACVIRKGDERVDGIAEYYGVKPEQVRGAYETIARAMFMAVRFGGAPCTGLPWRWGFGYPDCTPFDALGDARE